MFYNYLSYNSESIKQSQQHNNSTEEMKSKFVFLTYVFLFVSQSAI